MKWFKHDANALNDAKIAKMIRKCGFESYGLYFAVVEIIASEVDTDNLTFALEHDAEDLADRFKMLPERVTELLEYMISVELFERNGDGKITCNRLALRLDNATSQNPEFKKLLSNLKSLQSNLKLLPAEENRREEIILKDKGDKADAFPGCPTQQIIDLYHQHCPMLPKVRIVSDARKRKLQSRWKSDKKHQTIQFWEKYFKHVSTSPFLNGTNDRTWTADFEWLIHEPNFIKVIEGKYHGGK